MPKLGPNSGGGGGSGEQAGVPAGDYLAALKSFKRNVGKSSGEDFLRMLWEVIAGPLKGKRFFANMSCNLSTEGTVRRWQVYIEAADVQEEFELGSSREGNAREGDDNVRRLFVGVPVKLRLKSERSGQYINNDIEFMHYRSKWDQADKDAMNAWLDEQDQRQARGKSGGGGGYDNYDDPPSGPAAGGGGGSFADEDYGSPGDGTKVGGTLADDDDIPF